MRPPRWSEAAWKRICDSGLLEWVEEDSVEQIAQTQHARCWLKRTGCPAQLFSYSAAEAQAAGLWQTAGVWTAYPEHMLRLSARALALVAVFGEFFAPTHS